MLSGLSTEQLETIFIHELMHIKRNDFLINVLQSVVEAIFFFNPFVWIFSGIIKREREHCCDDAVVKLHGNALAYAHALTSLEEVRLSRVGLSVSLAESKNQLLNRITRLMEKSVKNYSGRERIIPALLLVIGLVCASWISTQTGKKEVALNQSSGEQVVQDTLKKNKKVKEKKRTATKRVEKAESDKNVNDDKNLNEDVTHYNGPASGEDVDLDLPPLPEGEAMIPPIPPMEAMARIPPMGWNNEKDWEEFGKEFGERFQEQFGDFYEKHGEDIEKLIEDIQHDVSSRFDDGWQERMESMGRKQEEWAQAHAEKWEKHAEALGRQGELMSQQFSDDAEKWKERESRHREEFEKNHKKFEERMKAFEERTKRFEEGMKVELIKDGYLGKDEQLTSMHWKNGSIEINGKKIKAEHEKKYNDLHKKYFQHVSFNDTE
jgi:hypothetical protein